MLPLSPLGKLFRVFPKRKKVFSTEMFSSTLPKVHLRGQNLFSIVYNDPFKYSSCYNSNVYSNLYFRNKKQLIGVLKLLTEAVQMSNGVLIFTCRFMSNCSNYMPIHEPPARTNLEGLLLDLQNDCDFQESHILLYKYHPIISVLNMGNSHKQWYAPQKSYSELYARTSLFYNSKSFNKKLKRTRDLNLDEISPVEDQDVTVSLDEPHGSSNTETRVVLIKPLLLESLRKESWEKKVRMEELEYKKSIRIIIMYTFAFCGLAITTFFVIYFA